MSDHPYDRLVYGLPIAGMDPDGTIRQGLIARCAIGGPAPYPYTGVVWDDGAVTVLPAAIQALYVAALTEARALHEVNGIRGDIGLGPLERLVPAVLDQSTDEPADDDPVTLSIVADAPDGWACEWVGWDRIDITGPERDPIHLVVPGCVDMHLAWGRGDMPTLTLDPPALVPYTVTPRFGEQLSLLGVAA